MNEWWNTLQTAEQVFYIIGLASTLVVFLQMLLLLLGFTQELDMAEGGTDVDGFDPGGVDADLDMDLDADADLDVDDSGGSGLRLISVRTVMAFFVGFGWSGALAMENGFAVTRSTLIALGGGAVFMGIVYYIMTFFLSLRHSGSLDYRSAIGKPATVYLDIPPNKSGTGKVQVKIQGRVKTIDAVSEEAKKIDSQSRVQVVGLQDENTVIVKPD